MGQEYVAVVAVMFLERGMTVSKLLDMARMRDAYRHGGREDRRSEWAESEK